VFERHLFDYLDTSQSALLEKIRQQKALDDELREEIGQALKAFKERYKAEHAARASG